MSMSIRLTETNYCIQLIPLLAKFTEETVGLDYKKNSWSLHNLCVLPEHQGKGLSKAMIQTIETIVRGHRHLLLFGVRNLIDINMTLAQAARDGTPLVLETNNERNVWTSFLFIVLST